MLLAGVIISLASEWLGVLMFRVGDVTVCCSEWMYY